MTVELRDVTEDDLPILFEQQWDPVANEMAAFPARDRDAFIDHWLKHVIGDETVVRKVILFDGVVAGNVISFERDGVREVGYWIARAHWGKGIATAALGQFLSFISERPLYAYVAKHNVGSLRVLQKCGFEISGERRGLPYEGREIDDIILILGQPEGEA